MSETMLKGRYRHLEEIGRGEHTISYKALDTSLDRTVAVKVLREHFATDPGFVERFHSAARAMAGLSHHNIIAIHDIGSDRDLHYVVYEYVEGQSLQSFLASHAPLIPDKALEIAIPICDALGASHRAGYIQGNLTPRDVLFTLEGEVKVSDFRVSDASSAAPAGEPAPSPYSATYLSPEQVMGRRPTPASDVYSAAVILYEMLAGTPPFRGETYTEIADQHIRQAPEFITAANPQIPRTLGTIVHAALAKTSADRYRTGSALAEALRGYQQDSARKAFEEGILPEEPVAHAEGIRGSVEDEARVWSAAAGSAYSEERPALQIDWAGCLLGIGAFVSVLGLIPLWLAVYLRYLT
jgi:serine/threonine protein kinase